MKNILNIDNGIPTLLSNVDDGTNTLYINDELVPSSEWTGTGYYSFTSGGLTFTIQKIRDNSGNIMLQLIEQSGGTSYRLIKAISNGEKYYSIDDPAETDLADGDYLPFYDTSAGAKKKSLWSNIVNKLKSVFVPLITNSGIGRVLGNGNYSWAKIATLKITRNYVNGPVVFEVSQREYAFSILQVSFKSVNNVDPELNYFITNNDSHYYIKKTATSTWELYGQYAETWGGISLHRVTGFRVEDGISITINLSNIAAPTDITQVTYGGNVATATNATNANKLKYTGVGDGVLTANQTSASYFNSSEGWASYLIFNHGDGSNYYHQMIRMPFGDVPQYQRMVNGSLSGWKTFITSENIGSQSVNYATSAGSANAVAWGNVSGKPSTFPPSSHDQAWSTITGIPTLQYSKTGYSASVGCVVVTHVSTGADGTRQRMFVYGDGNGVPYAMSIVISYTYVKGVVLCGNANKVGVRFISATQFAIVTGTWDAPVVCSEREDFSLSTPSSSYTIDSSSTITPLGTDTTKIAVNGDTTYLVCNEGTGQGIQFNKGSFYVKLGNMSQSQQPALGANRYVNFQNSSGVIGFTGSSRRIKENICNMTENEAQKLLKLEIVKFDYKGDWNGRKKNRSGLIAEDVMDIIPEAVFVSENYDPNLPADEQYNMPPQMDYQVFIPYLIKMTQIQQQEINELKAAIKALTEG